MTLSQQILVVVLAVGVQFVLYVGQASLPEIAAVSVLAIPSLIVTLIVRRWVHSMGTGNVNELPTQARLARQALKWLPFLPAISMFTLAVMRLSQMPSLNETAAPLRVILVLLLFSIPPTLVYRFFCRALRDWIVNTTDILNGTATYDSHAPREQLPAWLLFGKWLSTLAAINSLGMILLVAFDVTEMEGNPLSLLWNGVAGVLMASMLWTAHRCVGLPVSPENETPTPGFTAA
ncbi:hypothetical protein [Deinococcus sp. JMULE3]|uniref:hypothetical protein n=1 Tax=Deinococcus sp. JMULE3 TaxID=2518341 RepID=UPI0015756BE6|nr:hypothetical protein [Deinococcus sp. JMULE3]NTY00816.1 hypothetical protein [Deinococcus sp. JMULE3]